MRITGLVSSLIVATVFSPIVLRAQTFLTSVELRRAIETAPLEGGLSSQAGLFSLRLSPAAESAVIGIRRTLPGKSELHSNFTDVWYIIEGGATLITGGKIEGGSGAGPGEIRGRGIKNGSSRRVKKGDFAVIPAGTPHWISGIEGKEILYVVAKMPKSVPSAVR